MTYSASAPHFVCFIFLRVGWPMCCSLLPPGTKEPLQVEPWSRSRRLAEKNREIQFDVRAHWQDLARTFISVSKADATLTEARATAVALETLLHQASVKVFPGCNYYITSTPCPLRAQRSARPLLPLQRKFLTSAPFPSSASPAVQPLALLPTAPPAYTLKEKRGRRALTCLRSGCRRTLLSCSCMSSGFGTAQVFRPCPL